MNKLTLVRGFAVVTWSSCLFRVSLKYKNACFGVPLEPKFQIYDDHFLSVFFQGSPNRRACFRHQLVASPIHQLNATQSHEWRNKNITFWGVSCELKENRHSWVDSSWVDQTPLCSIVQLYNYMCCVTM